ncbi:carbon-nitrogen family hydrolase [Paenarthrobacter ureafaciens]|uniref:carbon-nitrogen family hydrolase n=1 Tax=Paenarthrobacter ureafaciens TaxID=37931 RepID=UPI001F1EF88F|nr:carbon-nitrogen family hydrolase [Paenarthrobacter ureafaciens]
MEVRELAPSRGQLDVAAVQVKFDSTELLEDRISRIQDLVSGVGKADLIVLPELWLHGGFSYDSWRKNAISLESEVFTFLSEVARDKKAWFHAGSFMVTEPSSAASDMWNTSVLFDPTGSLRATYKKIHRFGFSDGEPKLIAAGDEPRVVELHTERATAITGLSTCYDLRFPELYRHISAEGTALNVIPACWPLTRIQHWQTLGRARAIENQSFVVQCNMTGVDQEVELGGHSQIVDGNGDILAQADKEEAVLRATLNFDSLNELRSSFPVLNDRRADIWAAKGKTVIASHL